VPNLATAASMAKAPAPAQTPPPALAPAPAMFTAPATTASMVTATATAATAHPPNRPVTLSSVHVAFIHSCCWLVAVSLPTSCCMSVVDKQPIYPSLMSISLL